jgi:peptidoglycan-associated lipoprotein
MRTKILTVAAVFLCSVAGGFAQIQLDQEPMNDKGAPATSANDAKLAAVKPLPPEQQQQFQLAIKDIHFDFDRADLRPEDRAILASDAEWLKSHPDVLVTLEGDADERGDIVYNVVLSGERAMAAKDALVELGVPEDRIAFATGWGKLYPVCSQSDESCWSQNRRTHFETWPPPITEGTQVASR